MNTFISNKVTVNEAKRLLQEGCADYIQIHDSAGNSAVRGLDQQTVGNFFGVANNATVQKSPSRHLPILVTTR